MWIPGPVPYIVPPCCRYNPARPSWLLGGTLRLSWALTLESTVTRATDLGVSPHLPPNEEIYLLRDYRPTHNLSVYVWLV